MKDETVTDANDNAAEHSEISSIPDSLLSSPDLDLTAMSTVDEPAEGEGETGKEGNAAAAKDGGKEKTGEEAGDGKESAEADSSSGQETRYDKDPAWQRIIQERNEARAKLAALESKGQPPEKQESEELPYKDITKMSPEEVREWMEDDPIGYEANRFAQFHYESRKLLEQEQVQKTETNKIVDTFTQYAKENPDFDELWNSGKIEAFMQSNPGHNAISAHMMITSSNRNADIDKRIADAVAKATKEAEEKVVKNFQAKRNATVLSEGPAHRGGDNEGPPAELKNTKQFGGKTAVMAQRLAAMRNALH
ncbi:MAG: hypothetical protein PHC98_01870 [Syntrophotalea acetylenica]|nr:hypothetical protein [Syntrophotalea acetylenica]